MDMQSLSKPYFKIQPDYEGCLGYFSKDNCCYGCDDDTLELDGYESTPFVIPGIEDWCWEWDKENHFIKDHILDGMESDFDWATWYFKGLEMVKIIRANLPISVDVWYRIPFELRNVFPVPDLFVKEDGSFLIRDFLNCNK